MITSLANPRIRLALSLHTRRGRQRTGAFLVEGTRLVTEALRATTPQLVLHSADFAQRQRRHRHLLDTLRRAGAEVREVSPGVLSAVSDTVTPPGIVAVVPEVRLDPDENAVPLVLLLDGISDPGNAGAIVRVAAASGVTEVLAARGCVDLWSPKVVRAAAGAHFQVPIRQGMEWPALGERLAAVPARWLADPRGGVAYWAPDWTQPAVVVVSSEAQGASAEAVQLTGGQAVTVPMASGRSLDSLNVGVAAGIILFEALRQRTASGGDSVPLADVRAEVNSERRGRSE